MLMECVTLVVRLAILVIVWIVIPAIRRWIDAKTDNEKLARIKQAAETAVYAAEQLMYKADPTGKQRYNFVVSAVLTASEKAGMELSEKEIKAIVEAAVQELNFVKHGLIEYNNGKDGGAGS